MKFSWPLERQDAASRLCGCFWETRKHTVPSIWVNQDAGRLKDLLVITSLCQWPGLKTKCFWLALGTIILPYLGTTKENVRASWRRELAQQDPRQSSMALGE